MAHSKQKTLHQSHVHCIRLTYAFAISSQFIDICAKESCRSKWKNAAILKKRKRTTYVTYILYIYIRTHIHVHCGLCVSIVERYVLFGQLGCGLDSQTTLYLSSSFDQSIECTAKHSSQRFRYAANRNNKVKLQL